ncbi:MAG: hypothetical protein Q9195_002985 [Heterodermia aff. obscurata]
MAPQAASKGPQTISISGLLKELKSSSSIHEKDIAAAFSLIFDNSLSTIQCSSLLSLLGLSGRDQEPLVLAACAKRMREAAAQIDQGSLRKVIRTRGRRAGSYRGGLCDIVGTGGDGHSTFNVSTTASILGSSLLLIAKHGNRASSSTSGSADLLQAIAPNAPDIEAVTAATLPRIYEKSNYAFLFAPKFHTGMKHVATIRKELGFRTIFNLLGPLANPVEGLIEARIVGVAQQDLLPIFAKSLRLSGADKVLVVCGAENLDEISCAGITHCRRVYKRHNSKSNGISVNQEEDDSTSDEEGKSKAIAEIDQFALRPTDFGLPSYPLSKVSPGKLPQENAKTLMKLLRNELPKDDPVLVFVLINTAALFAISGICDADVSDMGHGDDGHVIRETGPGGLRWKEGVRRARWAIESGQALASLNAFVETTRGFESQ